MAGRAGAAALVSVLTVFVSIGGAQDAAQQPLLSFAYYVDYDPNSWQTLAAYGRRLTTVITTNFVVADQSGRIDGRHDSRVMDLARRGGAKVHFRISNDGGGSFNRAIAHAVLTDPAARSRAISGTLRALDSYGYDGVNIDLEKVPPGDRAALTSFTRELAQAVKSRGKAISIAVPGTTAIYLDDPSSGGFDLAALGGLVDWIIIMAYDEHWDTGSPGPVASLPWVEGVVRFNKTQVPVQKLLLGVAFYGYDWPRPGAGEAISMREAARRAEAARATIQW
ncbi:MAG: glycosyl hydrolase family 18 protein, partial [bacterium]